jgi:hypothetical protein
VVVAGVEVSAEVDVEDNKGERNSRFLNCREVFPSQEATSGLK